MHLDALKKWGVHLPCKAYTEIVCQTAYYNTSKLNRFKKHTKMCFKLTIKNECACRCKSVIGLLISAGQSCQNPPASICAECTMDFTIDD